MDKVMNMIIIGAGATAYCQHANPNRRPPLSNDDLLRMFNRPAYHIPMIDSSYALFFKNALKLYANNIEALFTGIYQLSQPNFVAETEQLIELKKLANHILGIKNTFMEMLTFFEGKLLMELQLCIGTQGEFPTQPIEMPICSWHRKIASQLDAGDVVVNFNYDLIMTYALLNEKKLSNDSFLNSYIKEVDIPEGLSTDKPVSLITPHGSFSWQRRRPLNYYDNKGRFHPSEQYYNVVSKITESDLHNMTDYEMEKLNQELDPPYIRVSLNNNHLQDYDMPRVILPVQKKKDIMDAFPHLKEEYNLFLKKLNESDTLYLIGKNFKDSDQDIALDIKNVCSGSNVKHIIYINPASINLEGREWVEHHNFIFNAASFECHKDLATYIDDL
jgi:hypothetical protein